MLVEKGDVSLIEVFFLIVGHTHSFIDQVFSVFAEVIRNATFIGSPEALRFLLENAAKSIHIKPTVVRQIRVVYDMKAALFPYTTKGIKYYQVFIFYCLQFNCIIVLCV